MASDVPTIDLQTYSRHLFHTIAGLPPFRFWYNLIYHAL